MAPVKIRRDEYEEKYYIPKDWILIWFEKK